MSDKILFVGAHPDDYEIGAAMKILELTRAGIPVYGVMMTDGENSNHGISRRHEGLAAAEMLGLADVYFLGFPDGKLGRGKNREAAKNHLEAIVKEIDPAQVYVHAPKDRHQDHKAAISITKIAARKAPSILHYKSPSTELESLGRFNIFFEGDDALLEEKIRIISEAYGSQIDNGGIVNRDRMVTEANFWAQNVSPYARAPLPLEAFFATKYVERRQ